jgi:hypothetical protein
MQRLRYFWPLSQAPIPPHISLAMISAHASPTPGLLLSSDAQGHCLSSDKCGEGLAAWLPLLTFDFTMG